MTLAPAPALGSWVFSLGPDVDAVLQPLMLLFCLSALLCFASPSRHRMRRQQGQATRATPRRIGNQSFLVHSPERAQVDVEGGWGFLGFFCPFAVVSPVPSVPVPCALLCRPLFSSSRLLCSPLLVLALFLLLVYGR
ncbi:hypothetical protein HDV63DRAFT_93985 [Trichoderma sp. SZMC 28014]